MPLKAENWKKCKSENNPEYTISIGEIAEGQEHEGEFRALLYKKGSRGRQHSPIILRDTYQEALEDMEVFIIGKTPGTVEQVDVDKDELVQIDGYDLEPA